MKTEQKILPIAEIAVDNDLYPRNKYNWLIAYKYSKAMQAGASFPPIEVAKIGNQNVLIDGFHRMKANKLNKQDHVSCLVFFGLTKEQVFKMAVETNLKHGYSLTQQETAQAIVKLEKMGFSKQDVSKITGIGINDMKKFVANRSVSIFDSSGGQIDKVVKAPLMHFAGQTIQMQEDQFDSMQAPLAVHNQVQLLDQMIVMLENDLFDLADKEIVTRVKKVKSLLRKK